MHTDTLMKEYIKSSHNLRVKGEKLSHIWFMTIPSKRDPIIITDGALNIRPNLQTKKMILKNVLKFTEKLNHFDPFISILSATEEILPQMDSSVEANDLMNWALSNISPDLKIYGPLAFDNSISKHAAEIKGIKNSVAGNANILLVPMVAFDKHFNRIGYGGGFYDRYIEKIKKKKNIITIGLAYSFQKVSKIPADEYDMKLDFIVTEKN